MREWKAETLRRKFYHGGQADVSQLQERSELSNHSLNSINELMQRWQDRSTMRNLRLADRFIDFELHVLLYVRVKLGGESWGVLFEPESPVKIDTISADLKQCTMLVNAVQLVDTPKRVIPTLVRCKPVDLLLRFWPDALYFSLLDGFISIPILRDWESRLAGRGISWKNVERPKCQAGWCGNPLSELAHIRLEIGQSHIHAVIPTSDEFPLQIEDVLFGPFNFYPHKGDSIVGRCWHDSES